MPNRILRDGINDSEAVNALTDRAELFYRRLMSLVDDYGRYEANPKLLRGKLFSMCLDRWSEEDVRRALEECGCVQTLKDGPLVATYQVGDKVFLQIANFGQRVRSESKFPAPGDECIHKPRVGYVYFVFSPSTSRIKIGYTDWTVEQRLIGLQTGAGEKLEILGYFHGTIKDEKQVHQLFSIERDTGEWFKDTPAIRRFIADKCGHLRTSAARASTPTTPPTTPPTTHTSGRESEGNRPVEVLNPNSDSDVSLDCDPVSNAEAVAEMYRQGGMPIPRAIYDHMVRVLISFPPEIRPRLRNYVAWNFGTGRWPSVAKTKSLKAVLESEEWNVELTARTLPPPPGTTEKKPQVERVRELLAQQRSNHAAD